MPLNLSSAAAATPNLPPSETPSSVLTARHKLCDWIRERDYSGYEPYDFLNSPYLSGRWARTYPINITLLQTGRRFAGSRSRRLLGVLPSKNPKALGLLLSAYCDLARGGEDWEKEARYLKAELMRLRSPNEESFCWGYDWDFYSWRGPCMAAFSPNSIATYFCGSALLDFAEVFGDEEARTMAYSAGEFFVHRLNRPVDLENEICFSYTPTNRAIIYNSSALVAAFFTRLAAAKSNDAYLLLARRAMNFLAGAQRSDGSWAYGAKARQQWVDHFHTGYNLCALLEYMRLSGDRSHESALAKGYTFYKRMLFTPYGAPKYFDQDTYPIDVHSCSQAILTLCNFCERDGFAREEALRTALWTIKNMQSAEGYFYYQRHRLWTNRTPYMRWGQAWMFHALCRLESVMHTSGKTQGACP
jgi:hypothetical protein